MDETVENTVTQSVKPGLQYDDDASVGLRVLGWHWNRLTFYSSVASPALASVQSIKLSKI